MRSIIEASKKKKNQNNVICSNMDGIRDDHTKWSKSDRGEQIYGIAYKWNLISKMIQKNSYKTETNPQIWKSNLWLPEEKPWEEGTDKLGINWDDGINTYTLVYTK